MLLLLLLLLPPLLLYTPQRERTRARSLSRSSFSRIIAIALNSERRRENEKISGSKDCCVIKGTLAAARVSLSRVAVLSTHEKHTSKRRTHRLITQQTGVFLYVCTWSRVRNLLSKSTTPERPNDRTNGRVPQQRFI